ncbi:MAG TPA: DUF3307 domain-containing protein [Mucilaginibacter sp.]|jgi:hypothetical protein
MELNILLRLLIAHLLSDFVFQPRSWVIDKEKKKEASVKLYLHVLVATVTTYLLLGAWNNWWIPLIIFTTHLCIDIWKSHRPNTIVYFMLDQLFHFAIILTIWFCFYFTNDEIITLLHSLIKNREIWALALGYITMIWPLGITIGKATEKWRAGLGGESEESLANAGIWIGRCERVLVLTFIVTNQYTALGFLIAAKSILRFREKDYRTQKKTEYIVVGTLMSFGSAVVVSTIIKLLL